MSSIPGSGRANKEGCFMPKVLVAGASGLVGHAAVERFVASGWDVVGVSRRVPGDLEGAELLSVDLTDAAACESAFGGMADVTHVVYAALSETPGLFAGWLEDENIERNGAMLRNLFEPLLAASKGLQHVSLLHGTKAYGLHHPDVSPSQVHNPLREREPRIDHRNFYFLQEDYLEEKRKGASWSMTVFRPTVIYGDAIGNNMNPIPAIGAYAALLRERGEPLHFPGRAGAQLLREAVDARLVASALEWAATSASAAGGTYNLTNGDVFTWTWAWPAIARALGMEPGGERECALAAELPAASDEWAAIVRKYGLAAPEDITAFVGENSMVYTDMVLSGSRGERPQMLNSTIAARQAGFADCVDSEDMFVELLRGLQEKRLLPPVE
jgi:nucleoside-diphosphate-sugar epimerase